MGEQTLDPGAVAEMEAGDRIDRPAVGPDGPEVPKHSGGRLLLRLPAPVARDGGEGGDGSQRRTVGE